VATREARAARGVRRARREKLRAAASRPTRSSLAWAQSDPLFALVAAQVSSRLDPALRDDIIMDVYLGLLEEQRLG
jgi:hypothetical protein